MNRDNLIRTFLAIVALFSVVIVLLIIAIIFKEGILTFKKVNVFHFLFGREWAPTSYPAKLGILPLIAGSLLTTTLALIIAVPISIGSALFISEVAKPYQRDLLKPAIELLAGIPSVIYGFFGIVLLAPLFRKIFNLDMGLNAFTASVILAIMVLPTIVSVAEDAINAVPRNIKYAAYSLGTSPWKTMVHVTLPAAKGGIIIAIILGFGRAIGETMVVLMVTGGAPIIPKSIFSPVQTMTGAIAAEMGEATHGGLHYHSLFAIALVLMLITLFFNIFAEIIVTRYRKTAKK